MTSRVMFFLTFSVKIHVMIHATKPAFSSEEKKPLWLSLPYSLFSVHHSKDIRIVLEGHRCTAATMKC